jgi:NADPH2:quinone reductase
MSRAVVLREHGGPEALAVETVQVPAPGAGELRLRQTWLGVNFHDIYVRSGLYKTLRLPGIPGIEGVGVVEDAGPDVTGYAPGDRVAYITDAYGCYASERLLPAARAVRLPADVDDRTVAAVLLKALTVEMLLHRVHQVRQGDWLLVHAAAGGVGRLLVQWAAHLGARVLGTVGSPDKARIATQAGCSQVILYRQEDVAARVQEITGGRGVDVVYDGVGKATFEASLRSLAPCAHLVAFGQASGAVEPVALSTLAARSTTLSRPIVFHYAADRATLERMSAAVFAALAEGWIESPPPIEFDLAQAGEAHRLLESGQATRPVVLKA